MNRPMLALAACTLLAACQSSPAPVASPVAVNTVRAKHPAGGASSKLHRATFANGGKSTGNAAQFATDCPWPAHAHGNGPRLSRAGTQAGNQAGGGPKADGVEAEGCAILRFALSTGGKVDWVEVVSAKPDAIGPLAIKCLLAARFKPDRHPDATSLVRVDVRKLAGDVAVAALKLR